LIFIENNIQEKIIRETSKAKEERELKVATDKIEYFLRHLLIY